MKALINKLSLLLIALTLTSCGGGGGTGGAFQPPPGTAQLASLSSASATTTSPNNFVDISVTARNTDNSLAKDGTTISAVLTPASIGIITTGGAVTGGTTTSGLTTGGLVAFRFSSGVNTGVAHMVFSTVNAAGSTISTALDINVNGGAADNRLTLTPNTITLPLNPSPGSFAFLGSPYLGEVTITRRHQNGQLITGTEKDNTSIAPVQIAAFSTLDDPATTWSGATAKPPTAVGNEFLTEIGSGPVSVTGGQGTIFVHAQNTPGTATLFVTATDADSGQTISASLTVNIVSTVPPLPSAVSLSATNTTVYTSTSGGNSSSTINAFVQTGTGAPVPDPVVGNSAYNNVQFEILGTNAGGAQLSATDASGTIEKAALVKTRTTAGVAAVQFIAGTQTGPVLIKATADRHDNNVDLGIEDPVTSTITLIISDGRLYSLTLSSPVDNALTVNSITGAVPVGGVTPGDPNATYSLTISAIGTDRQGIPVLPGVPISFGKIDAPFVNCAGQPTGAKPLDQACSQLPLIRGNDGNPAEGGPQFTAPTGLFTVAGGGAGGGVGPGDTLLVFGKDSTGNSDLENARIVQQVTGANSLLVTSPFNLNDTTGAMFDAGAVLPYAIGRSTVGNITTQATTNDQGVASVKLTYPVSQLGRSLFVWAQGITTDSLSPTGTKTVEDISGYHFPGVAALKITSQQSAIPGNVANALVTVCVTDQLDEPYPSLPISFGFHDLGTGSGSIDSQNGVGVLAVYTGPNGCASGLVSTSGIAGGTSATTKPGINFSVGGATVDVPLQVTGGLALIASAPGLTQAGGTVTLRLTDSSGNAVPNVQIIGTCTGGTGISIAITSGPGSTGPDGTTKAVISATGLSQYGKAGTASCTFTTTQGATPSATVSLLGSDLCLSVTDPNDIHAAQCPNIVSETLTVLMLPAPSAAPTPPAVVGAVTSNDGKIACLLNGTTAVTCTATKYAVNASVTLTATATSPSEFVKFTGGCTPNGAPTATGGAATVVLSTDKTCIANFKNP